MFNTVLQPEVRPLDVFVKGNQQCIIQAVDIELTLSLADDKSLTASQTTFASVITVNDTVNEETQEKTRKVSSAGRLAISDQLKSYYAEYLPNEYSHSENLYSYPYVINSDDVPVPGSLVIFNRVEIINREEAVVCYIGRVLEKSTYFYNVPPKHLDFPDCNERSTDSYIIRGIAYLPFYVPKDGEDNDVVIRSGEILARSVEDIKIIAGSDKIDATILDYNEFVKAKYFPTQYTKNLMFCDNSCLATSCSAGSDQLCVKSAGTEPAFKLLDVLSDLRLSMLLDGELSAKELINS